MTREEHLKIFEENKGVMILMAGWYKNHPNLEYRDVLQEIYLTCWKEIPNWDEEKGNLRTWLKYRVYESISRMKKDSLPVTVSFPCIRDKRYKEHTNITSEGFNPDVHDGEYEEEKDHLESRRKKEILKDLMFHLNSREKKILDNYFKGKARAVKKVRNKLIYHARSDRRVQELCTH